MPPNPPPPHSEHNGEGEGRGIVLMYKAHIVTTNPPAYLSTWRLKSHVGVCVRVCVQMQYCFLFCFFFFFTVVTSFVLFCFLLVVYGCDIFYAL